MLYKMCDNVALAGDLCRLATLKAMGKRRKIDIQLPPGEEVLGNQSVPDAVATHLFNLGLRAAGIPTERHAERREWKKEFSRHCSGKFFQACAITALQERGAGCHNIRCQCVRTVPRDCPPV